MLGPTLFVLYTQSLSQILSKHSCPHQFFADNTTLRHQENSPNLHILHVDLLTENKLQLNEDKADTILFNFSKLNHSSALLSICQATILFSNLVKNLRFYLDKDFPMKEDVNFIFKTAFLEIRHIMTTTSLKTPPKLLLFLFYFHALTIYCNSLLAGLPQSLIG